MEPQLPRKLARRDARADQLRRQRQAIGGVLADVRQAHLRPMNRGETLVPAAPVFCHAAKRSEYRLRNLLAASDRKKRPNPLLIGIEWAGLVVQFRQQGSSAENEPLPGQGHPAPKMARGNFAELLA
ncbi:MAG: hypothetical protein WBG11_01580 [Methylocella sp.]